MQAESQPCPKMYCVMHMPSDFPLGICNSLPEDLCSELHRPHQIDCQAAFCLRLNPNWMCVAGKAVTLLKEALALAPRLIELHTAMAKVLKHAGDAAGAAEAAVRAQNIDLADRSATSSNCCLQGCCRDNWQQLLSAMSVKPLSQRLPELAVSLQIRVLINTPRSQGCKYG